MDKIIQEVDFVQVVRKIGKGTRRMQAKILQRLELYLDKDSEEFKEFRKFFLDETSSNARTNVRDVFGDIEYLLK